MSNKELKKDLIAERMLGIINFSKKNKFLVSGVFLVLLLGLVFWTYSESQKEKDLKEAKILVSNLYNQISQTQNPLDTASVKNKVFSEIDSLRNNNKYKNSKNIALISMVIPQDYDSSSDDYVARKQDIIKNVNQIMLASNYILLGDHYSDQENWKLAIEQYKFAIEESIAPWEKAYSNYKLGLIHYEMKKFNEAVKYHEIADSLLNSLRSNIAMSNTFYFIKVLADNELSLEMSKTQFKK